ncbi:alkyl hydroperoxide reductase [Pandoraea terrae]|uniref:Alkyl hydroperoxide reductase n=1 Tax=Pandoraea terrae TaxID=1537710 RepID=A0A5E4X417_9BURK|nr:TlpA disulfide reductase family protein [Pandoraea terrae]VVE30992.1 alkyl hydroperoxide reductase [Pandoraea terrae]
MKATLLSTLVSLVFVTPSAHAWKPEVGEVPGEITTFEYVDGSALSLADLKGQPVLLYFGADWCIPCHKARPVVEKVAKANQSRGLKVIFLSNDDNRIRAKKQEEEKQMGARIAMPTMTACPPASCPGGVHDLGAFGKTYVLPTAVLLGADGTVKEKLERGEVISRGLEASVDHLLSR